jgi:hypothetical protein
MYQTDAITGETVFALPGRGDAREVVLEGFSETARLRVPMRPADSGWTARIAVKPGWFFYRLVSMAAPGQEDGWRSILLGLRVL